jgi:hypothetical protein
VSAANTWEKKILPVTFNYSGGTWDFTTGIGLQIRFLLACGTTFHTTKDAWQSGNYLATSAQVNCLDNTANDFFLTGVQFEEGSAATPFEFRPLGDELFLCQRYFQAIGGDIATQCFGHGAAISTNSPFFMIHLPVKMRAAPTGSVSAAGDFVANDFLGNTHALTGVTFSAVQLSTNMAIADCTVSGTPLTANRHMWMKANNTSNARIYMRAEL